MKKVWISIICFFLCCTFFCQYVAAATTDSAVFVPSSFMVYNVFGVEYNTTNEVAVSYFDFYQDYSGFSYWYDGDVYSYYGCDFQILGDWSDTSFFDTTPYDKYYLTFRYNAGYAPLVNGCLWLRVLDSSGNWVTYYDFDYAVVEVVSDVYYCTYAISDPSLIVPDNSSAFGCRCYWENYAITTQFVLEVEEISVTKEYSSEGGSSSGGGSSDSSSDTTTSSGGSGSGSGTGSDSSGSDYTVIVNKLDKVGELLDDLAANDIEQINLLTTQNVLIYQLPSKLRDMDVGDPTVADIDKEQLEDIADVESELYDIADKKLEIYDEQMNVGYNDYVAPSVEKFDSAHELFFKRLFDIPFINKIVYISLFFGLGAFVLRLGRKIQ